MQAMQKHIRSRKGQSVVEFALILPILLLLLCGMVDFGWILSNKLLLSYCSREGARYGALEAAEDSSAALLQQDVQQDVSKAAPSWLQGLTTTVSCSTPDTPSDGDIAVTVTCNVQVLTPVGTLFLQSPSIQLSDRCVMKAEQ